MRIDSRLAGRLSQIKPSSTLAITSKAKRLKSEGKDIISLAAGEPDFDTPDFVKEAAQAAIQAGFTKYTPTTGIPDLKKLIVEKFKKDNGIDYLPEQVIVSCGAKHSIFNALMCLVDPGDEVLIPSPFWVSYPEMVHVCGGSVHFIQTTPEDNFKLKPQDLSRHITSNTKVLIVNSPANPTGCVYTEEELRQVGRICADNKIFIISDEIYEKIIFDNMRHFSIAAASPGVYNLAITVNGLSKSHAMTGWRIGYVGAPPDIAEAMSKLQDHSTSNPTSIAQKAAVAALGGPDTFAKNMCAEFQKRRDFVVSRLAGMRKLSCVRPQGAFYIFCGIASTKLDSVTFATRLLDEAGVAVIPGDSFGRDDYVRMSFAAGAVDLARAFDRIGAWLNKV
jgi:aspartate aminotransferase